MKAAVLKYGVFVFVLPVGITMLRTLPAYLNAVEGFILKLEIKESRAWIHRIYSTLHFAVTGST